MFPNYDTHESPCPDPDVFSADRPPQLNGKNFCSCQCGCGCGGGGGNDGDGGHEDDAASTLVEYEGPEPEGAFSTDPSEDEQHPEHEAPQPLHGAATARDAELRARIGLWTERLEGSLDPYPLQTFQLDMIQDLEDAAGSMVNEAGSAFHSTAPSEAGSIRPMSPGPGIGEQFSTYHFNGTPLQLTPQHRYCRGLVASHLVLRDEMNGAGSR